MFIDIWSFFRNSNCINKNIAGK